MTEHILSKFNTMVVGGRMVGLSILETASDGKDTNLLWV